MFTKYAGILILLSFLTLRNTPFFLFNVFKQPVSILASEQDGKEIPEESKSPKQLEYPDEDFIHSPNLGYMVVLQSTAYNFYNHWNKQTSTAYLSLPYTPPERNS